MGFTIFQNGTIVDADEKNNNFYFVGQGNLLPRTGTSLTALDDTYDLGSELYTWDNVHCNNIHVTGFVENSWSLLDEITLSSTSNRIEFTNLNGDEGYIFEIFCFFAVQTATSNICLIINGDSSTNYGHQQIDGIGATITASRDTAASCLVVNSNSKNTTTSLYGCSEILIYTKNTGYDRLIVNKFMSDAGELYTRLFSTYGQIWHNTSDTITSLVFYPTNENFASGTNIQIWGIK